MKENTKCRKHVLNELNLGFTQIKENYKYIKDLARNKGEIIGSGEWLLDNIYLIEKEYKNIKKNMPKEYFDNLPLYKGEDTNQIPRILIYAKEFIKIKEGIVNQEEIIKFINRKEEKFTMGELWAFPLMLRISIIIELSRITQKLVKTQKQKLAQSSGEEIQQDSDDIIKSNFLEVSIEQAISICINSLREIEGISWRNFFNSTCEVEKLLVQDPHGTYEKMDFKSKDYYRHRLEKVSRKLKTDEKILCEKVLELSRRDNKEEYKNHVGYYLMDEGIKELAKSFKGNIKVRNIYSEKGFIALNLIVTVALISIALSLGNLLGARFTMTEYVVLVALMLVPANEIVVALTNWIAGKIVPIRFIPRLNFSSEVPKEGKTIIVIPAIVPSEARANQLMEQLEVAYLANTDSNFYFALLGDFKDSKVEKSEDEEAILKAVLMETLRLNSKYFQGEDHFFFFNREKLFNPNEGAFIGKERKRGKIMEFMALLKGDSNHTYNVISSDMENIRDAKYIITLDADTFMPRDSAKELVGAMSHVLNKVYRQDKKVLHGYGIMQPKVSINLESKNKSLFSRIFAGESGVDGYSVAYSDTYEDLFGEGSFVGKGIIDIDAFYSILKEEIPDNSVLSHDLLEGAYVRCGLITDVEFIDNYPSSYEGSCKRLHRWTRGDWQLLSWLFSSKISALSKWKLVDNLRRSLLAACLLLAVILNVTLFRGGSDITLLCFLGSITPLIFTVTDFVVTPKIKLMGTFKSCTQIIIIISFIPYQAYLMVDAIIRSLYRMFISKKNLLQWQTAEDAEKTINNSLGCYIRRMWFAIFCGVVLVALTLGQRLAVNFVNLPLAGLWAFSPYIAYRISLVKVVEEYSLEKGDKEFLRDNARRIWAYYEDFVNEENNYLAPDNYQEKPYKGVAHRTSPTNIGMGLTSNLVAYDLGYLHFGEVVKRLELVLKGMNSLEKYNGHFLNWYDTRTGEPLWPRYISTVDSGNLIGYMWIVAETLEEYKKNPLIREEEITALRDTMKICKIPLEIDKDLTSSTYIHILEEASNSLEDSEDYWVKKLKKEIEAKIYYHNYFFGGIEELLINKKDLSANELVSYLEEIVISKDGQDEQLIKKRIEDLKAFIDKVDNIIEAIYKSIKEMNFYFLYDNQRDLFFIGYNLEENSLGKSYYDLLASESRATSFITIALNQIPQKHWFNLGRSMTNAFKGKSLVSWSGTMFEYFMPNLIMKNYEDTLLDVTYRSVVNAQKEFAGQKNVPWGISESAYYQVDNGDTYQYKAFGVPGIGIKRGLEDELVISPYSTLISLPYTKKEGIENLRRLQSQDIYGRYGFIEAIDYTPKRVNKMDSGESEEGYKEVRCYMVHHLGMSFMALNNVLNNNIFVERFHRIPAVKATELLLQEKVPERITFEQEENVTLVRNIMEKEDFVPRFFEGAKMENPQVLLLSNGSYSTMLTLTGSGYGKKDDMTVYRWKGDSTSDSSGSFIYIKNLNSNEYWSSTYEPCKNEGEAYKVLFALDKATYRRRDGSIGSEMEVVVSPEDDVEIRRITLKNLGEKSRSLEITSYMEVTLQSFEGDAVHPSFSNLFISTEYDSEKGCLLGSRRARVKDGTVPFIVHKIITDGEIEGVVTYETSRINFIGRGRELKNPKALDNDAALLNTVGTVLDPIMSMRAALRLEAGEEKDVYFITGTANSKEDALSIAGKYEEITKLRKSYNAYNRAVQLELKGLGIKSSQANTYQSLASYILFLHNCRTDRENSIKNINKHQEDLWAYGISGDLPIVMALVNSENDMELVRGLIKMHCYWKNKGLKAELLIYNEEETSYEQPLQQSILSAINFSKEGDILNKSGGIFLHNKATLQDDIKELLIGIAALYVDGCKGSLITQVKDVQSLVETGALRHKELCNFNRIKIEKQNRSQEDDLIFEENHEEYRKDESYNIEKLDFYNGYGGFDPADKSYVIKLDKYNNTPAPWINVISNEDFGFHISEVGSSYTWCKNSRENKITTWSNDWIIDPQGEALFLRDDKSGERFSITPKPIRDDGEYIIKHSFGYSTFSHTAYGIRGEQQLFCPKGEKLKIQRVNLENISDKNREISLYYYAQLVLGVINYNSARYISTSIEDEFIMGEAPYSKYFGHLKAYLTILGGDERSFTGDRKEFIGVGEDLSTANALKHKKLSNRAGSIYDPCLACETKIKLAPGEKKEIIILFGQEENTEDIEKIIEKYKKEEEAYKALENVEQYWTDFLGNIQVKTKDKSMDYLLNGWLLYQTYSCRYLSRTAFYQSGGAYGFRDQLQDSMSLGIVKPEITKTQIIRSASRQYLEGDVQHWWHPVINSGIRTRFSDDLLWLPYVTAEYIKRTGDYSILDEKADYLEDEPLREGEDERYTIVNNSSHEGSIYEHCNKAIEKALKFGEHNIPLMGSGDWNDGMSTIGNKGKGESVWLGWFLYKILNNFIDISTFRRDNELKKHYIDMKGFIQENLEKNAWDGGWYRRAYFDDGTPLGSRENPECKIDSLAQSWAVISGAAKQKRSVEAMEAVDKNLVNKDKGMILLLAPPFESSNLEPGYIKGYVAGVRENGGQYTHAAVWVILALTKLGLGDKAGEYYNMINPINHTKSELECRNYKVEPYVMAADVYIREPHGGRGGWSWYTGASGWMYKVGIEDILGLRKIEGKGYKIKPCVPKGWEEYSLFINNDKEQYDIKVMPGEEDKILMNGTELTGELIPKDRGKQEILVIFKS
nr:glucoamylase family protein [Clostridium vincentii]